MIWNGTDPLQPDHEVAYRGWPTERVRISCIWDVGKFRVILMPNEKHGEQRVMFDGHYRGDKRAHPFDLIPLQQEPAK